MFSRCIRATSIIVNLLLSIPCQAKVFTSLSELTDACARLIEEPYVRSMKDSTHETLTLDSSKDQTSKRPVSIHLAAQLGAGYFGQVVSVKSFSDPVFEQNLRRQGNRYFNQEVVVKIPHTLKGIAEGHPLFFANSDVAHEYGNYKFVEQHVAEIEKHSSFPKNPAWSEGSLPVVPILGMAHSQRGYLLFKPKVEGWDLKTIAQLYAVNNGKLPSYIQRGLHDYFQFVQAVYHTVKPPKELLFGWGIGSGYSIDARPPNLVWLPGETPEQITQLKALGYKRPGFISFELGKVPLNFTQYIEGEGMDFPHFEQTYIHYLKDHLAKIYPQQTRQD